MLLEQQGVAMAGGGPSYPPRVDPEIEMSTVPAGHPKMPKGIPGKQDAAAGAGKRLGIPEMLSGPIATKSGTP